MKPKLPSKKLPFHIQETLNRIVPEPPAPKRKRWPFIVGILLVHLLLVYLLQAEMMRNALLIFKPTIVYATLFPPEPGPLPKRVRVPAPMSAKAAPSQKVGDAPLPVQVPVPVSASAPPPSIGSAPAK